MRRILLVLSAALIMVAMLSASAVTALAQEIACTIEEDYWTGEQTFVCYDYGY
jgi:hypothetical protein